MTVIPRLYVYAALTVLVVGGFAAYTAKQREIGRWQEKLRVADSLYVVQRKRSDSATQTAQVAAQSADSLRRVFRAVQRRDAAEDRQRDSVASAAVTARDSAATLLRDSLATIQQLRAGLGTVLASAQASDSVWRLRLVEAAHREQVATQTITQDSLALHAYKRSTFELTGRAEAAERQRDLWKSRAPSKVGSLARNALWLGAGVVLALALR
jgi:hypothetical protein